MVPTLAGRLQTRVFALLTAGVLATLLVTPLLPVPGRLGDKYRATFAVLLAVTVLGLVWELIYHVIQQFRWEKDWPTLFGLLTGLNEGVLVGILVLRGLIPGATGVGISAFVIDFTAVWIATWLWTNGPMRVPFIRWRFRGGRLV